MSVTVQTITQTAFSITGIFQSKLKAKGHLGDPTGITVLPNGNVLITDSQKNCVHQFDGAGKYQGKLGIPEAQQPNIPTGIYSTQKCNMLGSVYREAH